MTTGSIPDPRTEILASCAIEAQKKKKKKENNELTHPKCQKGKGKPT